MLLKTFRWSLIITALGLIAAFVLGGANALALVAILSVLEISLSFDNAVVNAKILTRMSDFWQKVFLTVGVAIAVFGMRLVFPLLIVGITAKLNPAEAIRLAREGGDIHTPGTYGYLLHDAHPQIAAFGGLFLLMLFLDWTFADREHTWLSWLERPLIRIGKLDQLTVVVAGIALVLAAELAAADDKATAVMVSGVLGMVTYLLVNGLGELFNTDDDEEASDPDALDPMALDPIARSGSPARAAGTAGLFLFLYIEVLDASFSFDGVIGAFAITSDIFIIAAGLGIGAMYIRSLTVYLVHQGTLSEYVYLEHGAHWAIGALSAILLVSIGHEVSEVITGLIGVGFIAAAMASSLMRNRREDSATLAV